MFTYSLYKIIHTKKEEKNERLEGVEPSISSFEG